ncbi:MAG: TRAP transporter small permease [Spirochaetia bacterium]|jgi:C4-dicarboxylate transporter DctQ subunit|nr:TRAP transporter small permease [Spirochaetia bacterium]
MTASKKTFPAEKISRDIDRIVGIICALFIGVMTFIVFLGVIFRYVFASPLNWVEEVSRYLMIWGASLAISLGVSAGEHVGLTVILDSIKKVSARKAMTIVINSFVFALLLFMFVISIPATIESRMQITQALGISMVLPKLAVPVAMGFSALQVILVSLRILSSPDGKLGEGVGYLDI